MSEVSASTADLSPADRRRLLEAILRKQAAKSRSFPLSFTQQRLWLLDQIDPGGPAYNIPLAIRMEGRLNSDALHRTLGELVARHESLRTRIGVMDDQPVQVVDPASARELPIVDLGGIEPSRRQAEAMTLARQEARKPFRLDAGPLFRAVLFRFSPVDHALVVVMHHIIADDWSLAILVREMIALYGAFSSGRSSPLKPLAIQFADYAAWQRQRLTGETLDRLLGYWREQLYGVVPLELPTDRPRPQYPSGVGGMESALFSTTLANQLKEIGRREGATLFMTLLAAFQTLLWRYSGQEDVAVGSPIAGRLRKETEGVIGFFANTLVMRTALVGSPTFRELLGRARQTVLGALEHQEMPFERLVEELNPPRDTSRHPLFQVAFTLQNAPWPRIELADITLSPLPVDAGAAKFDLWLSLRETAEGLKAELEYDAALFEPATAVRMLEHFRVLLESVAADPDQPIGRLTLLTEGERQQILIEWNDTSRDYQSDACLHELVESQAARTPQAIALDFEGRQLTYRQLNEWANRLARYLRRFGVGPDVPVGVCLERSLEMVASLLAIMKAGGAYAPLDPDYPTERLEFMVGDLRPAAVLTTRALAARCAAAKLGATAGLPSSAEDTVGQANRGTHARSEVPLVLLDEVAEEIASQCGDNLPSANGLDDVAYVIYTSGSTGRPKGVRNTHGGICNRLLWMQEAYRLTPEDRVLQKTPFSFDVSVWEFFWPLLTGARLVVARPGGHKDPRYLAELITSQRITTLHFVPSMLQVFLEDEAAGRCDSLRRVICSGEALSYDLQQRFFSRLGAELHNLYGPTEAAVDVTYWQCRPNERRLVPIGRPIANIQCYILDTQQNPVPVGVAGELHLGGIGLARDYLNRPELTAEKFIPDPFSSRPGARLYRTGDLCRYLSDGNIVYLGRLDQQVKIRGNRIELGEIQATLRKHPGVREAVVTAWDDGSGGKELAAYWAPAEASAEPMVDQLREFLGHSLPDYMIPAALVKLDAIPLNANGKVDYRSLPRPERQRDAQREYVAPRTPDEEQLAAVWQEVLRVERVGIHDNFFAMGGHSLLATQVVARIAGQMGVEMPLRDLFHAPTIAELAERLGVARAQGNASRAGMIPTVARDGVLLPSLTQEALWFLDQLERDRPTYTIFSPLRIRGRLNVKTVERALGEIARRHESLRTTFPEIDGRPVQVIAPPEPRALPVVDLSHLGPRERESELRRWIAEEMGRPIDLQKGPLIRITLVRLADDDHVAVIGTHHIIYDGWSMAVLLRELAALCAAFDSDRPSPLPELPIRYADYAAWQRRRLEGDAIAKLRDYWMKQLAGVPALELPADRPRPPIRTTRGATRPFELSAELSAALMEFCRREGTTPFMVLLAAFQVLLSRWSSQEDFAIGSPVANRSLPETEPLVGYFVNVVVLRSDLSGVSDFREVLGRLQRTALDAYENQEMTLDQVVAAVNPRRDMSRHPLFQAMFALQNIELPALDELGLRLAPLENAPAVRSSYFDLTLGFWQSGETFRAELDYATDLFDAETIDRMARQYELLLAAAIADPDRSIGDLPLLTEDERRQMLVGWNDTALSLPCDGMIHQLFEAHARRTPEAVAVVLDERRWTYRELDERSNQLARVLTSQGVGPEVRVGICLERSPELLMAVLAVLKAAGAYVPLDPAYTSDAKERVAFVLADAGISLVVSDWRSSESIDSGTVRRILVDGASAEEIAAQSAEPIASTVTAESLAYVLYTSGSTGRPKGVMVTHGNLLNAYYGWREAYRLGAEVTSHLQMASFAFDVFAGDMVRALGSGGTLVICRKETLLDAKRLVALMRRERVDAAEFVPIVLRNLVQYLETTGESLDFMRLVVVGSDAWFAADHRRAREVLAPGTRLVNSYGLTETTIDSSYFEGDVDLPDASLVPIGRPFANVRMMVLDGRMRPMPVGVPGELHIGGAGVSRGYVNAKLNADRFVPDPFAVDPHSRLCRTGDRARWRSDGQIEFLGRADNQVKIRGFRVEPGEVEEILREYPELATAVVVARARTPDDLHLVAYVVAKTQASPDTRAMRGFLARRVPDYMIPSVFVPVESIPATTSGKIDRRALPDPDWGHLPVGGEFVAPRTESEKQLAAVWSEVLGAQRVGIHDNFFDLGGNSLLALRLVSRIRSVFSVDLPLVTLFAAPTVAELAQRLDAARHGDVAGASPEDDIAQDFAASLLAPVVGRGRSLVPLKVDGVTPPLFCVHGLGGHAAGFIPLARTIGPRQVFALQGQGLESGQEPHDRIESMAELYVSEIREVQPHGPYLLCGWSIGGWIALEMARRLASSGEETALVAMLDTHLPKGDLGILDADDAAAIRRIAPHLGLSPATLKRLTAAGDWEQIAHSASLAQGIGSEDIRRLVAVCKAHLTAMGHYCPRPYSGRVVLVRAGDAKGRFDPAWRSLCTWLDVETVAGNHYSMLRKPQVDALAQCLGPLLDECVGGRTAEGQ